MIFLISILFFVVSNSEDVGYPGECTLCHAEMEVIFNGIFDTYACEKPFEEAVKLLCHWTGPLEDACKLMITGICDECRHVTKGHCDWRKVCDEVCVKVHQCKS